jgi:hypothetical protein
MTTAPHPIVRRVLALLTTEGGEVQVRAEIREAMSGDRAALALRSLVGLARRLAEAGQGTTAIALIRIVAPFAVLLEDARGRSAREDAASRFTRFAADRTPDEASLPRPVGATFRAGVAALSNPMPRPRRSLGPSAARKPT